MCFYGMWSQFHTCVTAADTACMSMQGGRYFTGHWFYSLWNTSLVVETERPDGSTTKEDPVALEPQRIFRASDHDNEMYLHQAKGDPYCNTQSLQTISR